MRNPIRLKNLRWRFVPLYVLGVGIVVVHRPAASSLLAALPLLGLGLAVRAWGAGHLVKNDALATTGPYAHLRHPLYLGTWLIGTGFAVAMGGWVGLGLAAVLWTWFAWSYFPRKERAEGRRLATRYPERFARYRAAVPALRPRLRPWREEGIATGAHQGWALARYSDNNELGTMLAVVLGWTLFWLRASVAP